MAQPDGEGSEGSEVDEVPQAHIYTKQHRFSIFHSELIIKTKRSFCCLFEVRPPKKTLKAVLDFHHMVEASAAKQDALAKRQAVLDWIESTADPPSEATVDELIQLGEGTKRQQPSSSISEYALLTFEHYFKI